MFFAGALGTGATLYFMKDEEAECASFSDKFLDSAMEKINNGVDEVIAKNPGMQVLYSHCLYSLVEKFHLW